MLPGVLESMLDEDIGAKQIVAISGVSTKQQQIIGPLAIGISTMSGADMHKCGMRGKAVTILHAVNDCLWLVMCCVPSRRICYTID